MGTGCATLKSREARAPGLCEQHIHTRAPQRDTLAWYRLACTLPPELPTESNLTRDPESRALAARDYAYLIEQLGPCARNRG